MIEDDPFSLRPATPPAAHEVGTDLSTLSEAEIEERIALLEAEIVRLRASLDGKRSSRAAADAFFKR
ncbi:DUF1192 domain-containing protein [Ancylobacter oerskovii]|uniref:DUF1192 domain-containing protein n=1 Tax=Ancylobacter oerskovii TaxID=459519 RepID=A0ABW4YSW0_9HYPH|nr:DUF1192 domain-containing protein [Ancylobacter oerskovii]MBS7545214.1 DUF1192 domain-containing protein [Ancylobacter oerskovii]